MDPFFHTGLSISDSLKTVRKSVLIYETIIELLKTVWHYDIQICSACGHSTMQQLGRSHVPSS